MVECLDLESSITPSKDEANACGRLEKRSVCGGDDDVPDDENLVRFQLSGSSNRQGIPGPSKIHLRKPHKKAEKGLRRYRRQIPILLNVNLYVNQSIFLE